MSLITQKNCSALPSFVLPPQKKESNGHWIGHTSGGMLEEEEEEEKKKVYFSSG